MANLSNINDILRISSSGVGLNKNNTGPSELDIESAGADMVDMTRTGKKTYRFAISGASDFSIFDVGANSDRLIISSDGDATFTGNITVDGTSSSLNTGNSGTFVTNDSSGYPRITTADATAQLGLFRSGGSAGGMYIGADSGGFEIMDSSFNTKFELDTSGNGTFKGNVTTDGIFKVDSAPDNNILEVDQSGRKMALKTSFASSTTGSFWAFKVSTGAITGTMTDALIVKPQEAIFEGSVTASSFDAVGNITTDGVFKVDSAPDDNILIVDQSGRKMALKTSFSSGASGNLWVLRTSTGLTNGTMTDALVVKPLLATFAGNVQLGGTTPTLNFNKTSSADILANIKVETDAGSGGKFTIQTKRNGNTALDALVINDDQNATFEGNINAGGAPSITPNTNFDTLVVTESAHSGITILSGNASDGAIYFGDDDFNGAGQIKYLHTDDSMTFTTDNDNPTLTLDDGLNATFAGSVTASSFIGTLPTGQFLPLTGGTLTGDLKIKTTSPDLFLFPSGDFHSFRVSAQENVANTFEITPSTTASGSTYSNPALSISHTGRVGIGVATVSTRRFLVKGIGNDATTASFQVNNGDNADILVLKDDKSATFSGNITLSSGFLNLPAGTEADPSLIFGGDDDTGLWHPASNTLAFSTFGDERMRIDSSGNVGIGTTTVNDQPGFFFDTTNNYLSINKWTGTTATPAAMIHLFGKDNNIDVPAIIIEGRENPNDTRLKIAVKDPQVRFLLEEGTDAASGFGLMTFETTAAPNSTSSGRGGFDFDLPGGTAMTITNTANVGIATNSPEEKLMVSGAITSTSSNSTGSTTGTGRAIMDLTSGGARMGHFRGTTASGSGYLALFTDSLEKMRITSAGNIEITSGAIYKTNGITLIGNSDEFEFVDSLGSTQHRFRPKTDNSVDIGDTGRRFKNIYATGATLSGGGATFTGNVTCSRLLTASGGNATDPMIRVNGDLDTGIFYPAADTFCITTNGTERARILSNGNFLIGTTGNTTTRLKVVQNVSAEWACQITSIATNAYGLAVDTSANTGVFSLAVYTNTGNGMFVRNTGFVGIGTVSPTSKLDIADPVNREMNASGEGQFEITGSGYTFGIAMGATTTSLYHNSSLRSLSLGTNSSEAITIDGSQRVGIGETSPDTTLHVKNSGSIVLTIERSGDGKAVSFNNGIQEVGDISFTGSNGVTYNSASDYRLKEDLQDFNGLDKISKIKMYDYKWKSSNDRDYGVMAHELQEILPHSVSGEKDGEKMQGVDYSKIVPLLVKSIQEQQKQIKELQDKSCTCNNCNCDK